MDLFILKGDEFYKKLQNKRDEFYENELSIKVYQNLKMFVRINTEAPLEIIQKRFVGGPKLLTKTSFEGKCTLQTKLLVP